MVSLFKDMSVGGAGVQCQQALRELHHGWVTKPSRSAILLSLPLTYSLTLVQSEKLHAPISTLRAQTIHKRC